MNTKLSIGILSILLLVSCDFNKSKQSYFIEDEPLEDSAFVENTVQDSVQRVEEELEQKKQAEQERIAQEEERKRQAIYDRYINNSLPTGATPYAKYYGKNSSCSGYDCSKIKVRTSNSDVLVTIKKDDRVVRHAYVQSNDSYTFSLPNGAYQIFFYYGKGWDPQKEMKNGKIKGGFIEDESFGKDDEQFLEDNILTYELILQQNGNFSTQPSDSDEAL
ncbi:hypothetical protein [Riemerella columbipharyngis]|uniref:Lipoprotein n=1 Tax=Riemerella columbipharyngis TaxID=1071918 RepID=A0A1G7BAZ5_9FLAO|nr:hypothetical protein [Riemerella columbipharyngis]SDE24284.1 hypothetical protein SAMN05421544_10599 [Riemerella columbipharyngis]